MGKRGLHCQNLNLGFLHAKHELRPLISLCLFLYISLSLTLSLTLLSHSLSMAILLVASKIAGILLFSLASSHNIAFTPS